MLKSKLAIVFGLIAGLFSGVSVGIARTHADAGDAGPVKPPLPAIESLKLEPESITLTNARDGRRVLVWGVTADGRKFDLTDEATFGGGQNVSLDKENYIYPVTAGEGSVDVTAAGKTVKLPVKIVAAENPKIRFIRDVEPILSQVGCNAGTCHGAAKGKNGFKLSLRGYDPQLDFAVLVQELQGRRVNRVQPENSLMLLKPTGAVPHEGRTLFHPGSRPYNVIFQWIKEGVNFDPDPVWSTAD